MAASTFEASRPTPYPLHDPGGPPPIIASTSIEHVGVAIGLVLALVALAKQSARLSRETRWLCQDYSSTASDTLEPLLRQPPQHTNKGDARSDPHIVGVRDYPGADSACDGTVLQSARLEALDAFRGLTLSLMVFVNYGGGGFAVFNHSAWDGLTVADLLFPWFAWILGFSVFMSTSRSRCGQHPPSLAAIAQRTAKLFSLGVLLNNGENWAHWRVPGVLQALSAAYAIIAIADRIMSWSRSAPASQPRHFFTFALWHVVIGVLPLVVGNLLLTFTLHVPDCPTGYLGPGGSADGGIYQHCTGGAHFFVDSVVFGLEHLFQTPTCQARYRTGPYDPEGLLNWLMVAVTAYLGYLSAALFTKSQTARSPGGQDMKQRHIRELLVVGGGLILSSIACGGLWLFPGGPWIPLNKNLWSLSYVLLSSGLAAWMLALFIRLVDSGPTSVWSGAPYVSVGKNSIAVYVMHEICQKYPPFAPKPTNEDDGLPQLELLLYNLVGVACWIVAAQWMHLRRIFIKV